jgi:hypothetical protein
MPVFLDVAHYLIRFDCVRISHDYDRCNGTGVQVVVRRGGYLPRAGKIGASLARTFHDAGPGTPTELLCWLYMHGGDPHVTTKTGMHS